MSYKFLVVDDEPDIVEFMQLLLEEDFEGCTVHALTDPNEALDYCRANVYDLILTDFKMPNLNGAQLIQGIRDLENDNKTTGVIVLTAHGEPAQIGTKILKNVIIMDKPLDREKYKMKMRILLSLKS